MPPSRPSPPCAWALALCVLVALAAFTPDALAQTPSVRAAAASRGHGRQHERRGRGGHRRGPGRRSDATPQPPAPSPPSPFARPCGLPGHEEDCLVIHRWFSLAVTSASIEAPPPPTASGAPVGGATARAATVGSCEALAQARLACREVLANAEALGTVINAEQNVTGEASRRIEGSAFVVQAPLRLPHTVQVAARFCAELIALEPASTRTTATTPSRIDRDADAVVDTDEFATVQTSIGRFTAGEALERARRTAPSCVVRESAARE